MTLENAIELKRTALLQLARKRQQARPDGFCCLHDFHGGVYECDLVSPLAKTASNVDSSVMIVAQDWSSSDRLKGKIDQDAIRLGYTPSLATNINLHRLLRQHFGMEFSETYATNIFPFIKRGPMNARIPLAELIKAAKDYLLPQIQVVRPAIVICLGLATFNAARVACGYARVNNLEEAIGSRFDFEDSRVFAVAHTGNLGTNTRGRSRVEGDWATIREWYKSTYNKS